jgi:hypothetical protein
MAQAVIRWPVTAEAWVRARVNPCGIYGGQSGTGTGFDPSSSVFPCQYDSTVALQTHIIWGMRNMLTQAGIHAWGLDPPHLQEKHSITAERVFKKFDIRIFHCGLLTFYHFRLK